MRCGDAGPARLCGAQLGTARCGAAAAEPIPPRRRPRPPRPPHPGLPDPPVQPRTAAEREGTDGRTDRGGTNGRGWDTRDLGHGYGDGDATTRGRLTGLGTDRRGQTDARMGGRAVGTAAAAQGNRTALRVHGSPTTTGTGPGLRSLLTARGCSPHKRLWGRRCAAGALALHPEQQQLKSAAAIKSSQQRSGAPAPKHQHGALAALFGDELTAAAAPLPPSPPPDPRQRYQPFRCRSLQGMNEFPSAFSLRLLLRSFTPQLPTMPGAAGASQEHTAQSGASSGGPHLSPIHTSEHQSHCRAPQGPPVSGEMLLSEWGNARAQPCCALPGRGAITHTDSLHGDK